MADNYLENKYEEFYGRNARKVVVKRMGQTLDSLLLKNRSYRGYRREYKVSQEMLEKIVAVNTLLPSARNQQVLRFRIVCGGAEADAVLGNIRLGAALPELHLPFEGTEPQAFIVVCSIVTETRMVDIDLGISLQSMLLKAVESGLNGIVICAFNKDVISKELALPYEPLAILAIGKGAENIRCVSISAEESHAYYRKDGIHYVPKVCLKDLLIR